MDDFVLGRGVAVIVGVLDPPWELLVGGDNYHNVAVRLQPPEECARQLCLHVTPTPAICIPS